MGSAPVRQTAHLRFDAARPRRQTAHLWFGPTCQARQTAHLRCDAAPAARATAHLKFGGLVAVRQTAHLKFAGGDVARARQSAHLLFGKAEARAARQSAHLLFGAVPEQSNHFPESRVTINGVSVVPISILLTSDTQQAAETAELGFARPLPAELLQTGLPVTLSLWGRDWQLAVEKWGSSREFGNRSFTLTATSRAFMLQARYAEAVNGQLTGLASVLAARLAAAQNIPLTWRMVDWLVQPGAWEAQNAPPLDLLRNLVSAAGGVLCSGPNGGLVAMPWPPAAPEQWSDLVAASVDSLAHMVSITDNADPRDLYDCVTVADSDAGGDNFRIEEDREKRAGPCTEVLAYQVPWETGDISHRGGPLVVLADLGVEERVIADELVTINGGTGRTQYPIYAVTASRWCAVNLGSLTFAEDGTLTSTVAGESLIYMNYRTRARRWKVYMGPGEPDPVLLVEGLYNG